MTKLPRYLIIGSLGLILGLLSPLALAEYALNFQPPVSEVAEKVYGLHMTIFYICVAIGVLVFGVMTYSIFAHRKSKGAKAAQFHESTTIEIVWTVVPFLILISMAVPATKTLLSMHDSSDSDMTIKIVGSQFKWNYEYEGEGVKFDSVLATPDDQITGSAEKGENYMIEVNNPVVIPVDTKVRFLITAMDVIHSWWVPAIAVKRDAIPGFINEMWTKVKEPGIYRGKCTELCGARHGFMPVVLEVKTKEDYQLWLTEKKAQAEQERLAAESDKEWSLDELMAKGETAYKNNCAGCHQANGGGVPPTFPALKGSPITTGADKLADHLNIVLNGKNAMPPFAGSLNDLDLAAIITYERNAWENNTGDVVQPKQVNAAR
jgi:cytochrome c oxidase subunit 2